MKVVKEEQLITVMDSPWSPVGLIREIVEKGTQEDPFYVMDLGEVVARYHRWKELMPRVEPFYAVKCNDDKWIVRTLAALGTGFDCASKGEIELVTSLGVASERIIFANPAKMVSHIRYSSDAGVDMMTFDSENELIKIKQHMPHAQLVIRIRCDAAAAECPLGDKFGCDPVTEAPRLLKLAADIGLNVVGVSFHVGSGAMETGVYARAIALCRALFSLAANVGHKHMRLLDIGGGYPGETHTSIHEVSEVINAALEEHFPCRSVRVIAEPGRYFAAAAYTLATMIHSKREVVSKEDSDEVHTMYYMNDGVYGSFGDSLIYNHHFVGEPLHENNSPSTPCSLWGPTSKDLDCVISSTRLPTMGVGEWLVFRDMGAYTMPLATTYNGFPVPTVRPVVDAKLACVLKDLRPLSASQFAFRCAAAAGCVVVDERDSAAAGSVVVDERDAAVAGRVVVDERDAAATTMGHGMDDVAHAVSTVADVAAPLSPRAVLVACIE